MGRALVVVRPRLGVGAHHELAILDAHLGRRRRTIAVARRCRCIDQGILRRSAELQRRQHGLVVLVLVLDDHAVDEPVLEQRAFVELDLVEHVEHAHADVGDVGARRVGPEQVELRPVTPRVAEGVVHAIEMGGHARVGDGTQQPLLLVVADVGQVPHQRRHQGASAGAPGRRRVREREGRVNDGAPPPALWRCASSCPGALEQAVVGRAAATRDVTVVIGGDGVARRAVCAHTVRRPNGRHTRLAPQNPAAAAAAPMGCRLSAAPRRLSRSVLPRPPLRLRGAGGGGRFAATGPTGWGGPWNSAAPATPWPEPAGTGWSGGSRGRPASGAPNSCPSTTHRAKESGWDRGW